jgi:hypothetical protein
VFGIEGMMGRFDVPVQTYEQAKAEFEAQDPIRILFDNGAGSDAGHPYPGFERGYESYPPPSTGRSWYLGDDGALNDSPAGNPAADGFHWDGANGAATNFTGNTGTGGLWGATPAYQWNQDPAGTSFAYATEALEADTTVLGSGAVDVWVRSSKPNVDLEVTISEIRPDGKESFVQGGWMRGDARVLDADGDTIAIRGSVVFPAGGALGGQQLDAGAGSMTKLDEGLRFEITALSRAVQCITAPCPPEEVEGTVSGCVEWEPFML